MQLQPSTYEFYMANTVVEMPKKVITAKEILFMISEMMEIPVTVIISKNRTRKFAMARHFYSYFCRIYTYESLKSIGNLLGGRDHSTIIHGSETITNLCKYDKSVLAIVKEIDGKLAMRYVRHKRHWGQKAYNPVLK